MQDYIKWLLWFLEATFCLDPCYRSDVHAFDFRTATSFDAVCNFSVHSHVHTAILSTTQPLAQVTITHSGVASRLQNTGEEENSVRVQSHNFK